MGTTMADHSEIIVCPAYGRDYATIAEAILDWSADLDFVVLFPWDSATYINRSDWERYGNGVPVWVRFQNRTEKDLLTPGDSA